jgi:hypothetical protein
MVFDGIELFGFHVYFFVRFKTRNYTRRRRRDQGGGVGKKTA